MRKFYIFFILFVIILVFFTCDEFNPFDAGGVVPGFSDKTPAPTNPPAPTPTNPPAPTPTPTPVPDALYFSEGANINMVYVDGTGKQTLFIRPSNPQFVRIHKAGNKVYWLENGKIYNGNLDGSGTATEVLSSGGANLISCFALDFTRSRLYFNLTDEVRYTSLTSPAVPGNTVATSQISILMDCAANGYPYWIMSTPAILYHDDTSVQSFYSSGVLSTTYFLRVDRVNNILYFYENGFLNGYNIPSMTPAIGLQALTGPFHDLCVYSSGGYLYLTTDSKIIRTNLNGQNQTDFLTSLNLPFGIDILVQ